MDIKPGYTYDATVIKVIDGDTVDLKVDLGFHVTMCLRFRLARINTAELNDPRVLIKDLAFSAKNRLTALYNGVGHKVTIKSQKPLTEDKYGRWIADIYLPSGECVNDILVTENLAKVYPEKY